MGIPWVLVRLSITVPVPVDTVPVEGTGTNPFKTYTVLEYNHSIIKPVYVIYGLRVCVLLAVLVHACRSYIIPAVVLSLLVLYDSMVWFRKFYRHSVLLYCTLILLPTSRYHRICAPYVRCRARGQRHITPRHHQRRATSKSHKRERYVISTDSAFFFSPSHSF